VTTVGEMQEERQDELPVLLERALADGCSRLAVVSLHPGAGARTAVQTVAEALKQRGVGVGVTSVERIGVDDDGSAPIGGIVLPESTVVATAASVVDGVEGLETLERVPGATPLGDVCICRLQRDAEVAVFGPDDTGMLRTLLDRLAHWSNGLALVRGAWQRPGFVAPRVSQAVVLAVGAAYSSTPAGSAAAVRYAVELLGLARCEIPADRAWREAVALRSPLVLDRNGRALEKIPAIATNPVPTLQAVGGEAAAVVLPEHLSDALLMPLARSEVRCTLVVRDATRVRVSPVYYRAWTKHGGRVAVVEPMRLLAVVTNPHNPGGPDAAGFRELVAAAVPEVPVRDVRLDAESPNRRPRWKFWA